MMNYTIILILLHHWVIMNYIIIVLFFSFLILIFNFLCQNQIAGPGGYFRQFITGKIIEFPNNAVSSRTLPFASIFFLSPFLLHSSTIDCSAIPFTLHSLIIITIINFIFSLSFP